MCESALKIVPGKTDAEQAAEFKQRMAEASKPLMSLLDEVSAAGFEMQFALGPGALGKTVIASLRISKAF